MTGGKSGGGEAVISERAILGAAVQSTEAAEHAAALLTAQHFSNRAHGAVFAAVARLSDAGHPVSTPKVLAELGRDLPRVVDDLGEEFMAGLLAAADGDVGYHAPRVLAAWQQRQAVTGLDDARRAAAAPGWDPEVTPDRIRALVDAATAAPGTVPLRSACDLVNEVIGGLEDPAPPGLSTGLADLDEATGGLGPGEVFVIGAATRVGKTTTALTIAEHLGTTMALPGLYCSLEMPAERLTCHRIAAAATVPLPRLLRHDLTGEDWDRVARAHPVLASSALLIDDRPGASPAHVRGRLRGMARAGAPARWLVVDYLQLMEAPKAENRQVSVTLLMQQVQGIARDHGIPVLVLAQFGRGPDHRPDKMPALSDFRESGAIEQTADVAILLFRDDVHNRESPRAGEMDLIVAKNRKGSQCTVTVAFQGHYCRVRDLAPAAWTPHSAAGGRGNGNGRIFVQGRD